MPILKHYKASFQTPCSSDNGVRLLHRNTESRLTCLQSSAVYLTRALPALPALPCKTTPTFCEILHIYSLEGKRGGGLTPNKIFIEADFFLISSFAKEIDASLKKSCLGKTANSGIDWESNHWHYLEWQYYSQIIDVHSDYHEPLRAFNVIKHKKIL